MRSKRLTLALGLALGTSFLVSAVFADGPTAAEPALSASEGTPPTQLAKLPAEPAKPADTPKAAAPSSLPLLPPKQLAQLTYGDIA